VIDLDAVCSRFKQIDLHDSRLLGLSLELRPNARVADAHLTLMLLGGRYPNHTWSPARLIFLDCTYSKIEIDHDMKQVSGDAITGSTCSRDSDLRRELEGGLMKHEKEPLSEYLEFVVVLCPPGGEMHFFARDFSLG
jgi:hypothetical protein